MTEVNLEDRINEYHDKQKSENYYTIPLKFLTKYDQIDEILFQNVKIVFNLENDMRKIFERNGTLATNPHKAAASYKFHKSPYITCPIIYSSTYYKHFKSKGMKSTNNYRFGITNVYTTRTYELGA